MRPRFGRLCKSFVLLICALAMPLLSGGLVKAAADPAPWFASTSPSLDKISDASASEVATLVQNINSDCQQREIITRPERKAPPQSKIIQTGCVTDTAYGTVSNGTYLQRQGSTVYGAVVTNAGGTTTLVPIPYSSTGLVISGGTSSGNYLWFIKNLDTALGSSVIFTGEVTHKLPTPYTSGLHDRAERMLATQPDTIGFSANGNWMIVDLPGIGTARVNTETYEVLPFGDAANYDIGVGVGMRTAISPDGRFAAVASKNFSIFKLYDLSSCGVVPTSITEKVSCTSRDLLPFIKDKAINFSSILRMRFRGDYTLDMYINSSQGNVLTTSHYVMVAAGQQAANFDYLALGDSFASGEGAYQYKANTDTPENKCHVSQRSYPYLISHTLNYGQYESVACSGAKIDDIVNTSDEYVQKHSQAKNKSDPKYSQEILSDLLPGYRAQKLFTERYRPNIITLSNGGNDVGFDDKIKRCIDSDTCYSSYEDRVEIVNEINGQFYRLTDMYNQIKSGTDPRVKLYVLGYPKIAEPNGNCALNVHLNNDEVIFSQQLVGYINSVIKIAAANAGAFYVDIEDAFAGHKLCETDSWNVAVNGLTAGNDAVNLPLIHGPVGNESFHPNAFGHEMLKNKILEKTNNFTSPMPIPDPNAVIQDPPASLPLLQVPKSNRTVKLIRNISGTDEGVLHYGETWVQNYSSLAPFVKASSTVHAWLNSEPVDLGIFTLDNAGNLTLQVNLPQSVPPGFHTLHLYGKNTSDEDVDLYQTVYVDGGVTNQCGGIALSGQDTDKDSVDDACDPMIDQPPAVVAPEPVPIPTPPLDPPFTTPPTNPPTDVLPQQPPVLPPSPDPNLPPPMEETPPSSPPPPTDTPVAPQPIPESPLSTLPPATLPPVSESTGASPNPSKAADTPITQDPPPPEHNLGTPPTPSAESNPVAQRTTPLLLATTYSTPNSSPDPQTPSPQVAAATTNATSSSASTTNPNPIPTPAPNNHQARLIYWLILPTLLVTLLALSLIIWRFIKLK